jgi:hypothetical protein
MSAVYGYEPSPRDDPLVQLVGKALDFGMRALTPERDMMVKTFPFCEPDPIHEEELILCACLNSSGMQY